MFTFAEFTSQWQRLHHPSTDVSGDVAFYYTVYERLLRILQQEVRHVDGSAIFPLLLYTENIIAIGLDGVYEYMYRSLGDVVVRWCDDSGMNANATSQVYNVVSEAVAKASNSSLRQWIMDSVLSGDFIRLCSMLAYIAREDRILRRIYPDLRHRKAMFQRLTGDTETAQRMLWLDMAFNWRDKHGDSLPAALAKQFRLLVVSADGKEKARLSEVADYLDTVSSERLDTYTVIKWEDDNTVTLSRRDGCLFKEVVLASSLAEANQGQCLAAQLVAYRNKTYVNGVVKQLDGEVADEWNGSTLWNTIYNKEREDAKCTYFITFLGKRVSLYEDLYTSSVKTGVQDGFAIPCASSVWTEYTCPYRYLANADIHSAF